MPAVYALRQMLQTSLSQKRISERTAQQYVMKIESVAKSEQQSEKETTFSSSE